MRRLCSLISADVKHKIRIFAEIKNGSTAQKRAYKMRPGINFIDQAGWPAIEKSSAEPKKMETEVKPLNGVRPRAVHDVQKIPVQKHL